MRVEEVIEVLDRLDGAGVRHWVAGGWGVLALAGRQTRAHCGLDVAVDSLDLQPCLQELVELSDAVERDCFPVRAELRAPGECWVDVHPVAFGAGRPKRQADLDGGHFDYPPEALADRTDRRPADEVSVGPAAARRFPSGHQRGSRDGLISWAAGKRRLPHAAATGRDLEDHGKDRDPRESSRLGW